MRPRSLVAMGFACLIFTAVSAQSNEILDGILAQQQATFADTAYLVMVGGGLVQDSASPADAFALARSTGWVPKTATADSPVGLESFCYLAMKALKINGGIGWIIFGSSRYAYRELVARGIANSSGGPLRIVSGDEVVRMLGELSALKGGSK